MGDLIGHADPADERIAFLADLIRSAADEARLNGLTDVLTHRRWLMEVSVDESAAPTINLVDGEEYPW